MLLQLRIRDFAIIDALDIELLPGFTVLTGETGAGKSILVDALGLVLGGRGSVEVVREGAEVASVEALFDVADQPDVRARLAERDLEGDDPHLLLVRRTVGPKGRAKVTLNGRLSTVATLAEVMRGLVDISGQHDQQSLLIVDNHLALLDAFGDLEERVAQYRAAYEALRRLQSQRDGLLRREQSDLQRADYLRFQLQELESIAPQPGEEAQLSAERDRLVHAERLRQGVMLADGLLYAQDGSAFDALSKAAAELTGLCRIDPHLQPTADVLEAVLREVSDAARALQRYGDRIEADPARLDVIEGRMEELRRLQRKHGGSIEEVLARRDELATELEALDNTDARLEELHSQVMAQEQEVQRLADGLTSARRRAANQLAAAVQAEVADMDLAGAVFHARLGPPAPSPGSNDLPSRAVRLGPRGQDEVEFLWSANRGEPPRPLARIASGGELSRLMLAVKHVLSRRDRVALLVFDEVDSGLGGRAADSVASKIQAVADGHQAIAITHLAPIAARAHHHLTVRKEICDGRTVSRMDTVQGAQREEEIARMIDGAHVTEGTRRAARDMLVRSRRSEPSAVAL